MTVARTRPDFDVGSADLAKLFDRLPPHAIEAEMCLLGSLILDWRVTGEVIHILSGPDDFYKPAHAAIYETVVKLYDQHGSLDNVQLNQSLRDLGVLDQVGGTDYLIDLAEAVPHAALAGHYARMVHDKALLRGLINAAGRILHEAHNATESAGVVLDQAETAIFQVADRRGIDEPEDLNSLIRQTWEVLQARHEDSRTLTGLATGFHQLDELLCGLQRGEMIIIAARPSMGKTALALNIAEHIGVTNRQPVAFFSLEMSKQQLALRLLCAHSGVDSQRVRRNMCTPDEFALMQEASGALQEAPIYVDDTPGLTVLGLRAKARRLASQHDIKAVFVDYMQLLTSPGADKRRSREQEVSEISRGIKALARELDAPIVCLSQLNRNPERRESNRPMLADLRESGAIEQDSDVVMMLHREEYYHKGDQEWTASNPDKTGQADLIISKQRNGPTGAVPLQFSDATMTFHERHPAIGEDVAPF